MAKPATGVKVVDDANEILAAVKKAQKDYGNQWGGGVRLGSAVAGTQTYSANALVTK